MCASVSLACVTLLLVTHFQAGEGLKCYESSCLKDHSKKTLRCQDEATSDMTLSECTPNSFAQRWNDVTKERSSSMEMKCVKLEAQGTLPKVQTGIDIIRMCAPKTQDMCEVLGTLVSTKIENSEVVDLRLRFSCSTCDTDACNSAHRNTVLSVVVLLSLGLAVLLPL